MRSPAFAERVSPSWALPLGLGLLFLLLAFASAGPWLSGHDPYTSDFDGGFTVHHLPQPPNALYPWGTDRLYRDVFSRVALATRFSLTLSGAATLLSTALGTVVGLLSGYFQNTWVDTTLMALVDTGLGLPYLLVIMALGASLGTAGGGGPGSLFWILGLTGWLGVARIVRATTIELRHQGYVEAARALGQSSPGILRLHILPHTWGPVFVLGLTSMAQIILAESTLGYLGLGLPPPTPTLGTMLLEAQDAFETAPWLLMAPGGILLVLLLGLTLVGEGLRHRWNP